MVKEVANSVNHTMFKFDDDHNKNGQFIRFFYENGKLGKPSALHIIDKCVYVSDWNDGCIVVYETSGWCVTSFGRWGTNNGEFQYPYCINSYNGQIYVCDKENKRIQIF